MFKYINGDLERVYLNFRTSDLEIRERYRLKTMVTVKIYAQKTLETHNKLGLL